MTVGIAGAIASLPPSAEFYNPQVGVVSLGELRVPVGGPDEDDYRFWEKLATQNLTFRICPDGVLRRGKRA